MIEVLDKKQCCGCEACVQICPKKCITMKMDEEGFYYPVVDTDICVNCGLCENVCPIKNVETSNSHSQKAYVAYAKDNVLRRKSSSGGIFSVLAEQVLNDNGVVFGAALDSDLTVHHICIDCIEDMEKLRGSKYVQSRIEDTYIDVKNYLDEKRKVLFTGTACQIAGLKRYLRHEYKNLITVDVLCHGVPSVKVWKWYLRGLEKMYGGKANSISFREKKNGWKRYDIKIGFDNFMIYEKLFIEDIFMRLFLKNYILRPSCYKCRYKDLQRPSDITIGDCWGIGNYMPEMDDDKGTSVIIIHSEKGYNILEVILERLEYREAEVDKVLPPYADSRNSVKEPHDRGKFFELFIQGASTKELASFIKDPLKVRIKYNIKKLLKRD